jgi:Na+-transporting NADH:ubiquinone oxidoreductase subunit C
MGDSVRTREGLKTLGFMLGVTFVFVSVLSAIHVTTRDLVARNETLFVKAAVREAAGLASPGSNRELEAWFSTSVLPVPGKGPPAFFRVRQTNSATEVAVVFLRTGAGLWGEIEAAVGLDPSLGSVRGVTFVKQGETPGLGARIEEPWFKEQLRGKTGSLRLVPEGTRSASLQECDAITGATITSAAVRDIVNGVVADAPGIVNAQQGK